ncbi:N-acyl-D-amino-acid deacylase family protein [Halegenticoccus tardaugens]|uniref:N-acyl-D-amino-acid deacylase family protein n=1 Tax=Halegenticoccus tardaugens TaxID=2071624 RepID=UPI00100A9960|nr:D-aminoacylase [Halegenticoccus tardaugens]
MALDILFENAKIVDGTGAPRFDGAVGVEDGRIRLISRKREPNASATDHVDVDGMVVAPGFIDTHSHSDLQLFADPTLAPKLRQGITTEILGHDGFSMAPISDDQIDKWRTQVRGLTGSVDVEWAWNSIGEYLDAVATNGAAVNLASLVGHGTVRFAVLGMDDREPTATERGEMEDLVARSLAEGAVGLSVGLIYPPSSYAKTKELTALAGRAAAEGRPFVPYIRSEGRWIWNALDELVEIGAEAGVACHLTHFKMAGAKQHGKAERGIHLIEAARERGVDITVEQYPYAAASTKLSTVLPPWVHAKGRGELLDTLRDDDARARMKRDVEAWRIEGWENFGALAGWDRIVITNVPSDENAHLEGTTVATFARDRDREPIDAVCDLLIEEELGVSMVLHLLAESDLEEILAYEAVNIATDGLFGGTPHPRVYGAFPRVLGRYVREKNVLSLEDAVRKMTSLPARAMGFDTKGIVRPEMDADLVVFDPDLVGSPATYENPKRRPRGVAHVVVNGEFAVRDGEVTGNTPGEVIRQ